MSGPMRIYLQPECCADQTTGRLWCENDMSDPKECPVLWVEYVRADTVAAQVAAARAEALRDALGAVMDEFQGLEFSVWSKIAPNGPVPRCEQIWAYLNEGLDLRIPEDRVQLDTRLKFFIKTITPDNLRTHYVIWFRSKRSAALVGQMTDRETLARATGWKPLPGPGCKRVFVAGWTPEDHGFPGYWWMREGWLDMGGEPDDGRGILWMELPAPPTGTPADYLSADAMLAERARQPDEAPR